MITIIRKRPGGLQSQWPLCFHAVKVEAFIHTTWALYLLVPTVYTQWLQIEYTLINNAAFTGLQVNVCVLSLHVRPLQQNKELVCFRDISPAAPHHYLVIPKQHIHSCFLLHRGHVDLGQLQRTTKN